MKPITLNPFLEQLRGSFGDMVFRQIGGRLYISRKPDMRGIRASPAQRAGRERFRQAVLYGQRVLADPRAAQPYRQAAERTGRQVFMLAVADFMSAPVIAGIDLDGYTGRPGDAILVRAQDDFEVVAVGLCLADAAGNQLEAGAALPIEPGSNCWRYTARTALPPGSLLRITVSACDRPGHSATAVLQKHL